jgi:hypothetical protein
MRGLVVPALLAGSLLAAPMAEARSGAVFIHGAGQSLLNNPAGARAYWSEDMLRASTRNWSVPYLVAHYDSNQFMWVGGDQVATQIYDWMIANGVDDIVVNTHSFGGTVIRWIMSNPTWNWRYPAIISRIRWVNTIAAPHKGSEAANLAGTLSGSWLTGWLVSLVGYNTDAIKNCRTDWMAYYNQYYLKGTAGRPALPRTIYTIAGTGLWNDFVHSEDYGLATLSGIAGMPGEDDGMVSQYSANGLGLLWFNTAANHHHNRRNDYRKIGDSLGSDFAALTLAAEPGVAGSGGKEAVSWPMLAGAFAEGERYLAPATAAPPQVSRTFTRTVSLREGRAVVEIPVSGAGRLVVWTVATGAGAVSATLRGPAGEALEGGRGAGLRRLAIADAAIGLGLEGAQEALLVDAPAAGVYRLELSGAGEGRTAVTVSAAQPESALTLTAWSGPLSRQPGQPVTVYARLAEGDVTVSGARVTARLAAPGGAGGTPLRLFDDGRHGDGAAGDGLYAARASGLANDAGLWTVRVEADGRDARGQSFARTGGSGFVSEPGLARLRPRVNARVIDDGAGRRLRVLATADALGAGRYRLEVIVAGRADTEGERAAVAWAEGTHALAAGRNLLTIDVPLAEASGDREPALVDVRLLGVDTIGLAGRATLTLR